MNTNQPYRVKKQRILSERVAAEAGDIVYMSTKPDYGCAREDTNATGQLHVSVTKEPDGDYPFFTIPMADIEAQPTAPASPETEQGKDCQPTVTLTKWEYDKLGDIMVGAAIAQGSPIIRGRIRVLKEKLSQLPHE